MHTQSSLTQHQREQLIHLFQQGTGSKAAARALLQLRSQGWKVNHKLVYKLMDQMNLKSKVRPRKKYSSYQGQGSYIAENLLNRNFPPPNKPNIAWVSDVTEFRVCGTKVYLSPIMDLYDRTILSYELSLSPNTTFTAKSLRDAMSWHGPVEGLIVHTDQGFQYQHSSWKKLIEGAGGVQSMSRKGNCYDNAVMENFFGHLRSEVYHGESFASVEGFCQAVDDYEPYS